MNEYIIFYYSLWLIYDLDWIDRPIWSRLWEKWGVVCCWWRLSADFNLCFHALCVHIVYFRVFYVFYPQQFPSQSNAASHTDQYCTCPHPNVLSVFIIDLLKCLYLYPLCVLVLIFQKSLIFSAAGVQETLLYAVLLSHSSKTRFQTE